MFVAFFNLNSHIFFSQYTRDQHEQAPKTYKSKSRPPPPQKKKKKKKMLTLVSFIH